jgi:hypothetical protein
VDLNLVRGWFPEPPARPKRPKKLEESLQGQACSAYYQSRKKGPRHGKNDEEEGQ